MDDRKVVVGEKEMDGRGEGKAGRASVLESLPRELYPKIETRRTRVRR